MYTTCHFKSAAGINMDILNAIQLAFKEKPIVITIEEQMDDTWFLMADPDNKAMLLKSVAQYKNGESVSVAIPGNPWEIYYLPLPLLSNTTNGKK